MPGDCKYYREEAQYAETTPVGLNHPEDGEALTANRCWCEHPRSSCDYNVACHLGAALPLQCGGDYKRLQWLRDMGWLRKCPLEYDGS